MSEPKYKRGDWVLYDGFEASGGAYIYSGQVIGIDVGPVTGEVYYVCYFAELKPSPQLICTEGELMPMTKVRD